MGGACDIVHVIARVGQILRNRACFRHHIVQDTQSQHSWIETGQVVHGSGELRLDGVLRAQIGQVVGPSGSYQVLQDFTSGLDVCITEPN